MRLLFSPEGRRRIASIAGPRLLCAFDFDGTLAPITPLPEQTRLPDTIRERLTALSEFAPVAIITGRSVADIRTRLGFDPDFVVGNHGLEGVPGWDALSEQHRRLCAGWISQLTEMLRFANDPGIFLENKRYSLSVHYRLAREPEQAKPWLESLFSRLMPRPRVVGGKYVFNLLAEDACNKGSALVRLMQICEARDAIYFGDDVTDEDVFSLRRPDILSVRIERHAQSAAEFCLARSQDILQLLDELTERLRDVHAKNWIRAGISLGA